VIHSLLFEIYHHWKVFLQWEVIGPVLMAGGYVFLTAMSLLAAWRLRQYPGPLRWAALAYGVWNVMQLPARAVDEGSISRFVSLLILGTLLFFAALPPSDFVALFKYWLRRRGLDDEEDPV